MKLLKALKSTQKVTQGYSRLLKVTQGLLLILIFFAFNVSCSDDAKDPAVPTQPGGKNPDPTDPGGKNPGGTNPNMPTIPDPTDTEPPAVVSGATFGDLNVIVWANPTDADFSGVLILRNTVSITDDAPSVGKEYTVGGDIGSSEVVQSANSSDFGVSAATMGTSYYYKIFAYDASHNYAAGVEIEATKSSDKTIFVNAAASGTGDGTSWSNAYSDLRSVLKPPAEGVVATTGDKIVVAKGVYKPTTLAMPLVSPPSVSDRSATFQLISGVKVYGGFDVADTLLSERNWRMNKTILSGDIDNNDTVNADGVTETTNRVSSGSTTATSDINGSNSYTVVTGAGDTTLEGFTITAGQSNASRGIGVVILGGGMHSSSDNLILSNIIFSGNTADSGGGMYNVGRNLILSNIIFSGNTASNQRVSSFGGGGLSSSDFSLTLSNIIFSDNKSAVFGGGMRNASPRLTLSNVIFSGNESGTTGGGLSNASADLTLTNVIMWGNTAMACTGNSAKGNANFCSGGMLVAVTISHSLIQGCSTDTNWWASTHANSCASGNTGNNIDSNNPLFADADDPNGADNIFGTADDGLRLKAGSPAIDAGSNGPTGMPLFATGALDLAGKARIVGNSIDMGAYESQ